MRVLLLSTALLSIAACSTSGPPGTDVDLTPPAFAERPALSQPPVEAVAATPSAPIPLMPTTEPATAPPPSIIAAAPPPPPPEPAFVAAPPPAPPEPVAVTAPEPVVVAAAPPPTAETGPAFPWPFAVSLPDPFPRRLPRLTLSNFSYDRAHVEAVVTANADCDARDAGVLATSEFDLAYNGTRVIEAPTGNDVCWRRDLATGPIAGAAAPNWSHWSRAYLTAGRSIDSRL